MEKIVICYTFEEVYRAYEHTRKGKRTKPCVVEFEKDTLINILSITRDLNNKTYKIGKYHKFYVYEPKKRLIKAPTFRDRVMQRALCQKVLEGRIEKHLIYDTYACRVGKGTHAGLYRFEDFLKSYYRKNGRDGWIIKGDISKYFYSIDHEILKANLYPLLEKYSSEWLLDQIIDSTETPGIPLGNQSSQWFANFYLSCFDHYCKEVLSLKLYIRYMDDWTCIVETKEEAQHILKEMKKFLWDNLGLKTNKKTQIFPIKNGVDFLGFHTYISKTGKVTRRLRRDSKEKMKKKLKNYKVLYQEGLISEEEIESSYQSWKGHAEHSSTRGLFRVADKLYAEIFEGDES